MHLEKQLANLINNINNLKTSFNVNVQSEKEFSLVFKGLGQFRRELKIPLKEGARPSAISTARTVTIPLLPKLKNKNELNKLLEQKVIVPVDFPTDWCSPIVVVPKKYSGEIRLCCDFIKLNNSVKRLVYPVPKIDVSLAKLKGAKIFSRLDANAGFHQLKLHKDSHPLTTFLTPFGRYMYTRLPFGVNCASDYFSKEFSDLLSDIPNIIIHIDDILIYSKTVDEHNKILRMVLQRLKKEGVTLNKQKCVFGAKEIKFLGHRISDHRISILPERVSAIANFPTPKNKESLLHFLGVVNYVGKFIPNKSYVIEPLNALLKDDATFVWLESQEQTFANIKQLVQKVPTLAHNYSKSALQLF